MHMWIGDNMGLSLSVLCMPGIPIWANQLGFWTVLNTAHMQLMIYSAVYFIDFYWRFMAVENDVWKQETKMFSLNFGYFLVSCEIVWKMRCENTFTISTLCFRWICFIVLVRSLAANKPDPNRRRRWSAPWAGRRCPTPPPRPQPRRSPRCPAARSARPRGCRPSRGGDRGSRCGVRKFRTRLGGCGKMVNSPIEHVDFRWFKWKIVEEWEVQ